MIEVTGKLFCNDQSVREREETTEKNISIGDNVAIAPVKLTLHMHPLATIPLGLQMLFLHYS